MKCILVIAFAVVAIASVEGTLSEKEVRERCGYCTNYVDPICTQNDDGEKKTFSNECQMWLYNCKNRERFLPISEGKCDKD